MSAVSTTTEPVRVFYGAQEVAQNPGIIDFSFEAAIPFDGHRFPVRLRSTWNGLEEIRGHIARLEERALQAEANLRHVEGERRLSEKHADAAERAAQDANEALRSLRSDQFECETLVPVGDVDGSGNVWIRLRSTEEGVGLLLKQLFRLDERAVLAEAALASANERCRHLEKRAERADWTASELRRAEFEWEDTIPVDEPNGDRVLVRVRGAQDGIAKIKAFIERLDEARQEVRKEFYKGCSAATRRADARADAAEAKLAALEAEQAEALANIAGFEVLPNDATTYTVSHGGATMTVTGSTSGVASLVKLAYGGFEYGVSA